MVTCSTARQITRPALSIAVDRSQLAATLAFAVSAFFVLVIVSPAVSACFRLCQRRHRGGA